MSRYAVIVERAQDGGYGAYAPDLPGCVAVGATEEKTLAVMREAIEFHLAGLRDAGEPVPDPATVRVALIEAA